MGTLEVGKVLPITGNITQLKAIAFADPGTLEQMVGYGAGRLSEGYWILLLMQRLVSGDRKAALEDARHFEFEGTTLRSGGRLGLPEKTLAADKLRKTVKDDILHGDRLSPGRSEQEYLEWKAKVAAGVPLKGPDRLAKIIPVKRLVEEDYSPREDFPMGGGALQWNILKTRPAPFLVAIRITGDGWAMFPDPYPKVRIFGQAGINLYDNRAKVSRYLDAA